jgi:hypothetical protein
MRPLAALPLGYFFEGLDIPANQACEAQLLAISAGFGNLAYAEVTES